MSGQFKILLKSLNQYIKRYFLYQLLYGAIIYIIFSSAVILILLFIDNAFFLNTNTRAVVFYTTILIFTLGFIEYIIKPIVKIAAKNSGKQQLNAAKIIAEKIEEVDDKLINILELNEDKRNGEIHSISLINASIEQKAYSIRVFKFTELISLRKIVYRISIIISLMMILGFTYIKKKDIINESTLHYIHYNVEKIVNEKLIYKLLNSSLLVEKGDNLRVRFEIEKNIEKRPLINYYNNSFHLKNDSINCYSYIFSAVNRSFEFNISLGKLVSKTLKINVLEPPTIIDFEIEISPPEYTGYIKQNISNIGDIKVIEGSRVEWNFKVVDVDLMIIQFRNSKKDSLIIKDGENKLMKTIVSSASYSISLYNEYLEKEGILNYEVDVIKDKFPLIEVNEFDDSSKMYSSFFHGVISDDYGIEKLHFKYYKNDDFENINYLDVPIIKSNQQEFFYYIDFNDLNVSNDDFFIYYFEVWDNDKINGSKSTRSEEKMFKKLTKKERKENIDEIFKNIERKIQSAMSLSSDMSNEIEKFNQKAYNKNIDNFEIKSLIENINAKKNELEKLLKEISKENREKNLLENLNKAEIEELREKQNQIQQLLDNILTDEIKKLIEELKNLIKDNLKDDEIKDIFKNLEIDFDELTKQMESNLELLKKFEVENRLNETLENLKKLSDELTGLKEVIYKKSYSDSVNSNKIEERKNEFLEIMEDYKKTKELNEELKYAYDLKDFTSEENNISNDINDSKENSEKGNNKKSAKLMQNAIEKINELANKMQDMINENKQKTITLNIYLLNSIISNISKFSFDQEELLYETKSISIKDPYFIQMQKIQLDLKRNFDFIKEQLDTLSYNSPMVSSMIKKDMNIIIEKSENIQESFNNRNINKIATDQQYVMTNTNNLILKLDELLMNMEESGNSSMSNTNCDKPGKPKPGFGDLKKQQEGFKNQLQEMINSMKSGKGKARNKELSKMLAKQEIMRRMIDEITNGDQVGKGTSRELNEIKRLLDENIKDIIQRKIDNNMLERQDLIRSRLLKAERAELEREEEKRRISNENVYEKISNSYKDFEYNKENYNFNELLNKENIKFNNFYKKKAKQYYERISN